MEAGLTQDEVAEKSGLDQTVINVIENELEEATVRSVLKYLDAIGMKLTIEPK